VAKFCERHFAAVLINNAEYKAENYKKALEETFVEIDYMLLNEEGWDLMR